MSRVRTLPELAEDAADRHGERLFLDFEGDRVTNFEILDRAKRLHGAFAELGLKKGDVLALCLVNHPLVYSIFGGGFRTGATVVPVIFQLSVPELRYIFGHTEAKGIVTDAKLVDKVREAISGLDHVEWLVVRGGATNPNATPREYALEDLLDTGQVRDLPRIDTKDVALMLYTSGTTGKPKGVMLAHENLLASGRAGIEAGELDKRPHPIISINALPMAHIFGVGVMNYLYMMPEKYEAGYSVQETWFDAGKFLELIPKHKCTDMACVPTMLTMILNHPDVNKYDLTSLVKVDVGAAPVPVEIADAFARRAQCRIRQLYGMTENAGIATSDRISQPYRPGSAGLPYPRAELRIVDDNGVDLPAGTPGEIVTRGPSTMKGYFKNPEATQEAIRDGWLHTGDIGYLDEDGWLYVVDRKKDMIIKGGENVYPAEVESVLYEHPHVAEAAVVGVPHDIYGEDIVAFVVPAADAQSDAREIIEFVRSNLSAFRAPSHIEFVDALPKSGVGKILRRELRDTALSRVAK